MRRSPSVTPSSLVPSSISFVHPGCHSPLIFVKERSRCHYLTWRGSFRLRTRSGIDQKTNYLPSRRRLLTWWLSSPTDFFKKKKCNKKYQNPKNLNVQKKEFKETNRCFNCDKQGHFTKACKAPKKKENEEATSQPGRQLYCYALPGDISIQ